MEIIYSEEKRLWNLDWLKQKKDRHSRYMAKHRAKYPIKPFLVSIMFMVGTLYQTSVFA